jgi:hypothetical protein
MERNERIEFHQRRIQRRVEIKISASRIPSLPYPAMSSKGQETTYDRRLLCKVKKRLQRKRDARQCARQGQESAYGEDWIAAW